MDLPLQLAYIHYPYFITGIRSYLKTKEYKPGTDTWEEITSLEGTSRQDATMMKIKK